MCAMKGASGAEWTGIGGDRNSMNGNRDATQRRRGTKERTIKISVSHCVAAVSSGNLYFRSCDQ